MTRARRLAAEITAEFGGTKAQEFQLRALISGIVFGQPGITDEQLGSLVFNRLLHQ
jgi:hypothetical protein